ncbi:MAG: universal stress protein [Sphaerochaetaceae bacterium]|jgi:nucleotide-binding universal stress UspA family protein
MNVPFHDILVYLDGSESSLTAAMYAITLAKSTEAKLSAVYVVNTRAIGELVKARIFVDAERSEYLTDLEADAERYLRHVVHLGAQKGVVVQPVKLSGTVYSEVRTYVKDNLVDLLVVGGVTEIRSRRDELMSETDRMLRTVPCPVLIVRDDDAIWDNFEQG